MCLEKTLVGLCICVGFNTVGGVNAVAGLDARDGGGDDPRIGGKVVVEFGGEGDGGCGGAALCVGEVALSGRELCLRVCIEDVEYLCMWQESGEKCGR